MADRTATIAIALATEDTSAPREQWVHLIPVGPVLCRDGREFFLDDMAAVIDNSRQYAGSKPLVVDYEHQTDYAPKNGQAAPAAGWLKDLQARPNGIWGLAEWTERAASHLRAKEYRYLSPVFGHTPDGRVTLIVRAALTNTPALELTALARSGDTMDEFSELRKILGLPETADLVAITAAVRELVTAKASATPDPLHFVPIADFERVTRELNALNRGVAKTAAEECVANAIEKGRLPPYLKDWGISLCSVNKPAFDAFVDRTAPAMARLFSPNVPGHKPGETSNLTDVQMAVCTALGHEPAEFSKHVTE